MGSSIRSLSQQQQQQQQQHGEFGLSTSQRSRTNHSRKKASSSPPAPKTTTHLDESESAQSITNMAIDEMKAGSIFFAEHEPRQLPTFEPRDVIIGTLLGYGEFGEVFECVGFSQQQRRHLDQRECQPNEKRVEIQCEQPKNANSSDGDCEMEHVVHHDLRIDKEAQLSQHVSGPKQTVRIEIGLDSSGELSRSSFASSDDADDKRMEQKALSNMINRTFRGGKPRYAVKKLREKISMDVRDDAIIDLACEAQCLSRIKHPNIVRLRGVAGIPGTSSFMLIMDRLEMTLECKISAWREEQKSLNGRLFRRKNDKPEQKALLGERLLAAYDVARAMRHLHSLKLLFRDLKPENIGVTPRGDFRLFDFGLCKELKPKDLVQAPDCYNATGVTGSRRFMAPEVVKCLPYGFSADVYSFGILFWSVAALRTPFKNYNANQHMEKVVLRGERPNKMATGLAKSGHKSLLSLMEACWCDDLKTRPSFDLICEILQSELLEVEVSNESVIDRSDYLLDRSVRSQYVPPVSDGQ